MSFIVSYITDSFVAIAADKRTTYRRPISDIYDDNTTKITKCNDFMYSMCGHVDIINIYERNIKASNFIELENYSDDFIRTFDKSRETIKQLKEKRSFQLHIACKNKLIVYMVFKGEEGCYKAVVPINSKMPSFSAPDITDIEQADIERYITENYPSTIDEACAVSKECIEKVSELDSTVSKEFDFEYIESH